MALAYAQSVGDGVTRVFTVPFPYISKSHVQIKVDGVLVTYSWLSDTSVQITTAPAAGSIVDRRRVTPRDTLLVDFVDGSTLVESDLDLSALQVFYLSQEAFDLGEASLGVTDDGSFSALGRRISNVLDPILPLDVANKRFVENGVASQVAIATQKASEAASSAALAAASAVTAGGHAASASSAKDNAISAATSAAASASSAATNKNQTQTDREATTADRVQTGLDRVASAQSATAAAQSAAAAALFDPSSYYVRAEVDALVSAALPVATVIHVADTAAPAGFLKANGAAISRTAYAKLFAKIGTLFGAGDGSNTFNIPDLRGEFIRGLDDGRGIDAARSLGSYQASQNLAHNHPVTDPGHAHGINDPGHAHGVYDPGHSHGYDGTTSGSGFDTIELGGGASGTGSGHIHAAGTGIGIYANVTGISIRAASTGISVQNSGGSEARPRNVALLACIKY